jgi:hypothetical protein
MVNESGAIRNRLATPEIRNSNASRHALSALIHGSIPGYSRGLLRL